MTRMLYMKLLLIASLLAGCTVPVISTPDAVDTVAPEAFRRGPEPRPLPYEGCGCFTAQGDECTFVPNMPRYACAASEMSSGPCPEASLVDSTHFVGCCHPKLGPLACYYSGTPGLSASIYSCQAAGGRFDNIPVPPVGTCTSPI
jgi:hypothetical protein